MRRVLVILAVLTPVAVAAAAWLLPVVVPPKPEPAPEAVVESGAECDVCALRHQRLRRDKPAD